MMKIFTFAAIAIAGCGSNLTPTFTNTPAVDAGFSRCPGPDAAFGGDEDAGGKELSGYPGEVLTFEGTGFDTEGYTEVFFGRVLSPRVICPSSTQCAVVVPAGSGVVPVTIDVFGECTVGFQFLYLPSEAGSDADAGPIPDAGSD
jgi:hypothetical protein